MSTQKQREAETTSSKPQDKECPKSLEAEGRKEQESSPEPL